MRIHLTRNADRFNRSTGISPMFQSDLQIYVCLPFDKQRGGGRFLLLATEHRSGLSTQGKLGRGPFRHLRVMGITVSESAVGRAISLR